MAGKDGCEGWKTGEGGLGERRTGVRGLNHATRGSGRREDKWEE